MAQPQSRTFHWQFDNPAGAIWPLLADTVRFNEAAGLPRYEVSETAQPDGSVLYEGRMKRGPVTIAWREIPVNWVAGRWFEHRREFLNGPLQDLTARLVLSPREDGAGCRGDYTLTATPANLLGRVILKTGFFESTAKTFATLAADADRFAGGLSVQPFSFKAPAPSPEVRTKVAELVSAIEAGPHGNGLAARLAEHLLTAQEADLVHLRPLGLARAWQVEERAAIELCLEAVPHR